MALVLDSRAGMALRPAATISSGMVSPFQVQHADHSAL